MVGFCSIPVVNNSIYRCPPITICMIFNLYFIRCLRCLIKKITQQRVDLILDTVFSIYPRASGIKIAERQLEYEKWRRRGKSELYDSLVPWLRNVWDCHQPISFGLDTLFQSPWPRAPYFPSPVVMTRPVLLTKTLKLCPAPTLQVNKTFQRNGHLLLV